jgi:P4 family phage/plasmid primase-like protien
MELEDVPKYFNNGQNIGILLGEPSGGLVDVDLDVPVAVAAGRYLLPDTLRSGRESSQDSHYWYRCDPAPSTVKFQVPRSGEGPEMFVELRSTGKQTVVAPSVHPDGDQYIWGSGETAELSGPELLERVREVATAALLARHWPMRGRHEITLAAAGYLGRRLDPERVEAILYAAAAVAGDEEERDRRQAVQDTLEGLQAGRPMTGGPALDQLAPGVTAILTRWWGWRQHYEPGTAGGLPKNYEHSDLGNAERFIAMHGEHVRWSPTQKSWLVYDGAHWACDGLGYVTKLAHLTARSIHEDAAHEPDLSKQKGIARFAVTSQNENRINGMLSQAKPYLAVSMDDLDSDPWLFNCLGGTLDLRTGRLTPHNPADLITRLAPVGYDPEADCPRFERFLKETLVDDAVISFIKRFAGYSLTGSTRERAFAILYGFGKNGKTTLIELLQDAIGDYATNTDVETILIKNRSPGASNDVAALKGARFVSAAEVEQNRGLAESKVKQLTGSDTVTARFLFREFFDYRPEFKLWLSTNNKPLIKGTDDAIWDRVRLVPFTQRFEGDQADLKLPEKLRQELPGILAWLVQGCLEWQQHGLGEPEGVRAATAQYRQEMDTLAAFLDERCVVRSGLTAPATPLYKQYQLWCDDAGEKPETQKTFGMRLSERGFSKGRETAGVNKGRVIWLGIGLRTDNKDPNGGDDPSPGEGFIDDPSPRVSGVDMPDTRNTMRGGEGSEGKNHKLCPDKPHEEKNVKKPFTPFTPFTPGPEEPADDSSDLWKGAF